MTRPPRTTIRLPTHTYAELIRAGQAMAVLIANWRLESEFGRCPVAEVHDTMVRWEAALQAARERESRMER